MDIKGAPAPLTTVHNFHHYCVSLPPYKWALKQATVKAKHAQLSRLDKRFYLDSILTDLEMENPIT